MNKEQEIKEIMLDIPQKIVAYDGNPAGQHLYGEQRQEIAEALYSAGYRKTFTSDLASDTQKAYKEGYIKGIKETEADPKSISIDTVKEMNAMCNIDDIVRGFIVKDGKILYVTNILNGCRQEFKDIHKICDELNNNMKEIDRLMEWNNYLLFQLEECKKLTVKEFAQKLKARLAKFIWKHNIPECIFNDVIADLLKEYEK